MRICLFTTSLHMGGAERVFVNLANHWAGHGHQIDFVILSLEGGFKDALLPEVNLIDLGAMKRCWPNRFDFIGLFASYLRQSQPDQVFSTLTYVTITTLWAAKLAGYRGRVVVRQANSLLNQSKQALPVRIWNWIGYKICYRWASAILVNSRNSLAEMLALMPAQSSRLHLVYNPVMVAPFVERTEVNESIPIVLAAGRFAEQKDYPALLKAFQQVLLHTPARLVILGDGPLRPLMESLIDDLGIKDSVELAGYVSDVASYYARARVFVLTSKWEGFPNVLVEALAAGVPAVATDCKGASREILEPILPDNIVPVGDVDALAERVIHVLEHEIESERYRDYIRAHFDLPVIAEQYLNLGT